MIHQLDIYGKDKVDKAIEIMKSRRACAAYVDSEYVDSVDIKVIDMAISALEKQEGKKVRVTTSTKRCPSCNKQVSGIGNIHPNYKYCRYCGQKILLE